MPRRQRVVRSRHITILILFLLAGSGLLWPSAWSSGLISLVQVLVPFQDAALIATDSVTRSLERNAPPVPAAIHDALEREKLALKHRVASLAVRVAELEEENSLLTATRLFEVDAWRVGAAGRLVPARVLTKDLLGWRSSRLIAAGRLQGVRRGSAVASRFFEVDKGTAVGVGSGMAVLRGEVLVGLVEQVGTHTARVKLLDDVTTQMRVRIGRFTEDGFVPVASSFWLVGRGGGVMEVREVDRRLVRGEAVQVGDTVLSDPTGGVVPAALTIGRITSIEPDHEKPLLSILTVDGAIPDAHLERVWVYDPE